MFLETYSRPTLPKVPPLRPCTDAESAGQMKSALQSHFTPISIFTVPEVCVCFPLSRRTLFRHSSILSHCVGSGASAFSHKRPSGERAAGEQSLCTSYFIEPVQWMEKALLGVMDGQVKSCLQSHARHYYYLVKHSVRTLTVTSWEISYTDEVFLRFVMLVHSLTLT